MNLGASALTNSYTESTWPIHINDLNCSGSEESIWNCPHNGLIGYSCSHYDDAAVLCQSEYIYYTNTYLQAYYVCTFALQLQGSTNYIYLVEIITVVMILYGEILLYFSGSVGIMNVANSSHNKSYKC